MLTEKPLRLLSIGVGILMLFHGVDKILNGIDFVVQMLEVHHIPYSQYLAYGVYLGEVVAPIMLIIGRNLQIAGGLLAVNMLVAIWLVHSDTLFMIQETGAWSIETPLLYLIAGLTIALSKEG